MEKGLASKLEGRKVIVFRKRVGEEELIEDYVTILEIISNVFMNVQHNGVRKRVCMVFAGYSEAIYQIKDANTRKLIYENGSILKEYNQGLIKGRNHNPDKKRMQSIREKGVFYLENI